MTRLYDEFERFLARERVTKADFCRFTGFPPTTLATMRHADHPRQETVDRLLAALNLWRQAAPGERTRPAKSAGQRATSAFWPDDWTKAAENGNRAYTAALRGARFQDGGSCRIVIDLARPNIAISRDPCGRCGTRGDIGCEHQLAMAGTL